MHDVHMTEGEGRVRVQLDAYRLGGDWLVVITNENAHVGAVGVGELNEARGSVSASVISALGHRDDHIAQPQARAITKATGRRTCVVAGVHVDHITAEEIETILAHVQRLVSRFLAEINDPERG